MRQQVSQTMGLFVKLSSRSFANSRLTSGWCCFRLCYHLVISHLWVIIVRSFGGCRKRFSFVIFADSVYGYVVFVEMHTFLAEWLDRGYRRLHNGSRLWPWSAVLTPPSSLSVWGIITSCLLIFVRNLSRQTSPPWGHHPCWRPSWEMLSLPFCSFLRMITVSLLPLSNDYNDQPLPLCEECHHALLPSCEACYPPLWSVIIIFPFVRSVIIIPSLPLCEECHHHTFRPSPREACWR